MSTPTRPPIEVLGSFAPATTADLEKVYNDTAVERVWLKDVACFESSTDVLEAVENGELVKIEPATNYRPIRRYLTPELAQLYPPYLRPTAAQALTDITDVWRQVVDELDLDPDICLSLSSLTRSVEYQRALVATGGKLAVKESSHTAGMAFDIDASGYYVMENGVALPVSRRPEAFRRQIGNAITEKLGVIIEQVPTSDQPFDQLVMAALEWALTQFEHRRRINVAREFTGTNNACLHVAVNPRYLEIAA